MAECGYAIEHRLAPPAYRRSRIVTLSTSSKREIVERLGIPPERVSVSPPGVEPQFTPGGALGAGPSGGGGGSAGAGQALPSAHRGPGGRSSRSSPACGPSSPAKATSDRPSRTLIRTAGAESWISLPGYVADDDLVDLYRSAWVVASTSLREGWGMTVTEAGACGTPAVATRISGHQDAVIDGRTGMLVDGPRRPGRGPPDAILGDEVLRQQMGTAAARARRRISPGTPPPGGPWPPSGPGRWPAPDRGSGPSGLGWWPAGRVPGAPARRPGDRRSPAEDHLDHAVGAQEDHPGPGQSAGRPEGERPRAVGEYVLGRLMAAVYPPAATMPAMAARPEDDAQPGHQQHHGGGHAHSQTDQRGGDGRRHRPGDARR